MKTVLIIDDNPNDRELLVDLLVCNKTLRRPIEATNGEHALNLLNDGLIPDIVITDFNMGTGRMNGGQFLAQSHKNMEKSLKIIFTDCLPLDDAKDVMKEVESGKYFIAPKSKPYILLEIISENKQGN